MTDHRHGVLLVAGRQTHQENYAPQFVTDPRCRLVALSDEKDIPDKRKALNAALADELEIPYIADLDRALELEGINIVSVCAEPERRGRILVRCASAGKHLYIDKPMTPFPEVGQEVIRAVAASGVRSQMYSFVNRSWCRRAKAALESGELGKLVAIHADCLFAKGPNGSADLTMQGIQKYPPTRFTFTDSKAELYAIGVYPLGLVCWLSGRRVEEVYGCTRNYFFSEHQKNGQEDFGTLSLHLEGGVTATVTGGRIGWTSHSDAGLNHLYLIGTRGSLRVDANEMRLECSSSHASWRPPRIHPEDPMGFWQSTQAEAGVQRKKDWTVLALEDGEPNDVNCFIDCIEEGRESEMNARAAAHLTDVLLAAYRSAVSSVPEAVYHESRSTRGRI